MVCHCGDERRGRRLGGGNLCHDLAAGSSPDAQAFGGMVRFNEAIYQAAAGSMVFFITEVDPWWHLFPGC